MKVFFFGIASVQIDYVRSFTETQIGFSFFVLYSALTTLKPCKQ